jgi:transcription antitermination protein NusB
MISRRNIRVKVMQTLYTMDTLENEEDGSRSLQPQKILQQHFDQTRAVLTYLVYFLTEIARYSEKDAHQRASKHLPSAEDLKVNTKIAGNTWLWKVIDDTSFKEQVKKEKPELLTDRELLRRVYQQLSETDQYKKYIALPGRETNEERAILEFILSEMLLGNEAFVSQLEENFTNWQDDGEMVVQLVSGFLHKPGSINFAQLMSADKQQFATGLLQTVIDKSEHLQELIIPKLKNWDPERIALLDMIMMKMGVAEFLYFETIPPKVTINEYIDLAKEYSTAQSGQFVNGILDNIHKELVQDGKMKKVEYRKA